MPSLPRIQAEQLKWTSRRKKAMVKAVRKRMHGDCPVAIVYLTAFTIDFLRFDIRLSCWYGLQTSLN